MRRLPGQAAMGAAMALHGLCTLAITLAVLASVGLAAFAWRLSQGPVDLDWLTRRLEDAANAGGGPTRLAIGSAALTWEGFRMGVDRPLDLRLTDVTVTDQAGKRRIQIPSVEVSLSLRALLFWRIVPRAIAVDSPQLTVIRGADGTFSLDLGSLTEATDSGEPVPAAAPTPIADLLAELAKPPGSDRGSNAPALLGQLRVLRVRDARIAVVDRQLGATWLAPDAEINLTRRSAGGLDGTADITLAMGDQRARLNLSATLGTSAGETHLRARMSPVTPRLLAGAAPGLAALAAVNAPVGWEATLDLDATLALRMARISLHAGAGTVHIGGSDVPLLEAALAISGTPEAISLQALRVMLPGHDAAPPTRVEVRGQVNRRPDQVSATLSADLDEMDFADLGKFWPEGTGGGARSWLVANIPVGMARHGHVDLGLTATPDLGSLELTRATGTLDGEGLEVHWLRPIPPIDNGQAQLRIIDPDTLEIVVAAGRQRLRNHREGGTAGLQIRGGRMRITGIMQPHQLGAIETDITGSLSDAVALLREPRLGLFERHPLELKNPSGQANVKVNATVPLENGVSMDDIPIRVHARLDNAHAGDMVAGHDLDQGVLDITASNTGMKVTGRALLAAIPAKLDAAMDFRAGAPAQVWQTVTVSGQTDARQLAALGLDVASVLNGSAPVQAVYTERRNGQAEVAVNADLTGAELVVAPLEWRKPREVPAKGSARVALDRGRLTGLDSVQLEGDGLALRGRAEITGGRLSAFRIDRLLLGRTVAQGVLSLPAKGPVTAEINGATLDLAERMARHTPPHSPPRNRTEPPPGPAWTLDARFDQVLMAQQRVLHDLVAHVENDGRVVRQLRITGRTGARGPFQAQIVPEQGGRRFSASADDAGEVLRGVDILHSMEGGRLSVQGHYDDAQPGRPLIGTATIEDFRVRNAPALGKLLQAMTLYGLIEVMQGPGLGFSRLVGPFRLTEDALDVTDARAFSQSLGLTLKGRFDLDRQVLDLEGTIVPAYFFNSLLGNVPLVGKLFSPERGGGVFAASYRLRGPIADPEVSVNPLAALTPGFLRGVFGLF